MPTLWFICGWLGNGAGSYPAGWELAQRPSGVEKSFSYGVSFVRGPISL